MSPVEMRIWGPWQIAAIGFSDAFAAFTNSRAFGTMRKASPLTTPPGSSTAS